jgi:hypothetical protein
VHRPHHRAAPPSPDQLRVAAAAHRRRSRTGDDGDAEAVAEGVLSTGEAWELSQVVDTFIRAIDAGEFEARLQRLEAVNGVLT